MIFHISHFRPNFVYLLFVFPGRPNFLSNTANSIYCPPHLKAQCYLRRGVLHTEEKDYDSIFEIFVNLCGKNGVKDALGVLKYMWCKLY